MTVTFMQVIPNVWVSFQHRQVSSLRTRYRVDRQLAVEGGLEQAQAVGPEGVAAVGRGAAQVLGNVRRRLRVRIRRQRQDAQLRRPRPPPKIAANSMGCR